MPKAIFRKNMLKTFKPVMELGRTVSGHHVNLVNPGRACGSPTGVCQTRANDLVRVIKSCTRCRTVTHVSNVFEVVCQY